MKIFSFDYETFYSKDYSIRDLGNWAYTHHPEFEAYMLAVSCDEGEWVGSPKDFDWELLRGQLVIAHNAGFEQAVTDRLKELGIVPADLEFGELVDTADLAAYLGVPRNLAGAAQALLGVKADKTMRDKAKGKRWKDMTPDFQERMSAYAAEDAILERRLWLEHSHKWPTWERVVSRMTREMCKGGLPVNVTKIKEGIDLLEKRLEKTRSEIPYAKSGEATPLARKAMHAECAKHGIAPPKSMAKTSVEFSEWILKHGEELPWARAIGEYRSVNMLLKKLQTMQERTRPDGIMPYALKYGGAHTLRDSGDAGFNPQNLSRKPMFDVDIRGMIEAPEGKTLGVFDLRAIEPCCLADLSEDEEMVDLLRQGYDVYESHARVAKGYTDPRPLKDVDKDLRQLCKVEVLGLGYGAGAAKLVTIAKTLAGLDLTDAQAAQIVAEFRTRRFIPKLWNKLEAAMRRSIGNDFEMQLPSGRVQRYRDVKGYGGLSAAIPRNGIMMRLGFWGGTLTENLIQGAARDVFMDRYLAVIAEGYNVILRVHDELVVLLNEEVAEADQKVITQIMSTPPQWWQTLPVSAEGHLCKQYSK